MKKRLLGRSLQIKFAFKTELSSHFFQIVPRRYKDRHSWSVSLAWCGSNRLLSNLGLDMWARWLSIPWICRNLFSDRAIRTPSWPAAASTPSCSSSKALLTGLLLRMVLYMFNRLACEDWSSSSLESFNRRNTKLWTFCAFLFRSTSLPLASTRWVWWTVQATVHCTPLSSAVY